MDKNLFDEVYSKLYELKVVEYKYRILTQYIKDEAKGIYFDKEKILKMIEILDAKKNEDIENKENIGEENE